MPKAECLIPCWHRAPDADEATTRRRLLDVGDVVDVSPDDPRLSGKEPRLRLVSAPTPPAEAPVVPRRKAKE